MPLTTLDPTAALIVIDLQKGIVGLPTVHPTAEIVGRSARLGHAMAAFWASLAFIAGLLVAAAATMYPYLLRPHAGATGRGLTIFQAAPPPASLALSLAVAVIGLIGVIAYSVFLRRRMPAKVSVREEGAAASPGR